MEIAWWYFFVSGIAGFVLLAGECLTNVNFLTGNRIPCVGYFVFFASWVTLGRGAIPGVAAGWAGKELMNIQFLL